VRRVQDQVGADRFDAPTAAARLRDEGLEVKAIGSDEVTGITLSRASVFASGMPKLRFARVRGLATVFYVQWPRADLDRLAAAMTTAFGAKFTHQAL
jgi:hypothetical protein